MSKAEIADLLNEDFVARLFPNGYELIPDIDGFYEIELAFYESQILSVTELISRSAYFARINGEYTHHFLMCTGEPLRLPSHSSSRLKSFFEKNIFRTGYATHGLFPYRGKFHPQMIRGLLNVMGLKSGETVLDPMMGSGTVPVEASLMGINVMGLDASPFCRFMAQTKLDAMVMPLYRARNALANYEKVFKYFTKKPGLPERLSELSRLPPSVGILHAMYPTAEYVSPESDPRSADKETLQTYNFLLLAYLDAAGYFQRSQRRPPDEQFKSILERYLFVAEKIQAVLNGVQCDKGTATISEGDARSLQLDDCSVDGIIFSPPYSFAIDYLDNDAIHIKYLGFEVEKLREKMVGLRGRSLKERLELYKIDMNSVLKECGRVIRKHRFCTIIVGTNTNQLSKVLGLPANEVPGLDSLLVELAEDHGLRLVRTMRRSIVGISNTMRKEYILLLQKT